LKEKAKIPGNGAEFWFLLSYSRPSPPKANLAFNHQPLFGKGARAPTLDADQTRESGGNRAYEPVPKLLVMKRPELLNRERVHRLTFFQMTMLFAAVYKGCEIVVSYVG